MECEAFEVTERLFAWRPADSGPGGWHFIAVPGPVAAGIRRAALARASGFGSVRVTAEIGDTRWRTSLFPHKQTGGFLLPVTADVRRREGISAGDEVTVRLEVGEV